SRNEIAILDTFYINYDQGIQGFFSDIDQPYVNEEGIVQYFDLDFVETRPGSYWIDSLKRIQVIDDRFSVRSVSVLDKEIGVLGNTSDIWSISYDQNVQKYIACESNSCFTIDKSFSTI